LLAARDGGAWCSAAAAAARTLGIRIDAYRMGAPGLDDRGVFAQAYGLESDGAVLVRPDGHVGWRSAPGAVDDAELISALNRILAR